MTNSAHSPRFLELRKELSGKFDLMRELPHGGCAELAFTSFDEKPAVIKIVDPRAPNTTISYQSRLEKLHTERQYLERFNHQNIMCIYSHGTAHDMDYLVMPYRGVDLDHLTTKQFRKTDIRFVLHFYRQAISALIHIHDQNVVHRDVALKNFLLNNQGEITLIDFGMAAQHSERPAHAVGTPTFSAPEQFKRYAYPSSDVYSLGVVMYMITTGCLPFLPKNYSPDEWLKAKLNEPPFPLRDARPDIPPSLEKMILSSLTPYPPDRPATEELDKEVSALQKSYPLQA